MTAADQPALQWRGGGAVDDGARPADWGGEGGGTGSAGTRRRMPAARYRGVRLRSARACRQGKPMPRGIHSSFQFPSQFQ
jgi:hypothetical protein